MGTKLEEKDVLQNKYRAAVKKMGDILYYRYVRNNFNSFFDVKTSLAGLLNKKYRQKVL